MIDYSVVIGRLLSNFRIERVHGEELSMIAKNIKQFIN